MQVARQPPPVAPAPPVRTREKIKVTSGGREMKIKWVFRRFNCFLDRYFKLFPSSPQYWPQQPAHAR